MDARCALRWVGRVTEPAESCQISSVSRPGVGWLRRGKPQCIGPGAPGLRSSRAPAGRPASGRQTLVRPLEGHADMS